MQNAPYGRWLPWDASATNGAEIDGLINVVHWFMALLFVGWGIFFVYCLFRFRQRSGHAASYDLPKGKVSKYAEIGVAIFEAVLLLGFSMPVWARYKNEPPKPDNRVEVRAIGQQFQWNFHYPGKDGKFGRTKIELINASQGNPLGLDESDPAAADDIVSPEMHMPVDRDIYCMIMAKDVIHSFAVPVLRVKQDAIPGMQIPIWFKAKPDMTSARFRDAMKKSWALDSPEFAARKVNLVAMQEIKGSDGNPIVQVGGFFTDSVLDALKAARITSIEAAPGVSTEVVCAQLCGNQHYKMHAPLIMETREEFEKWQESQAPSAAQQPAQQEFEL